MIHFTEDVITSIDSDILLNGIIRLIQWRGLFTKKMTTLNPLSLTFVYKKKVWGR